MRAWNSRPNRRLSKGSAPPADEDPSMTPSAQRQHGQSQSVQAYSGFERQPIAGEWRHGRGSGVNLDHDPYSGAVLVQIPEASREDMSAAYEFAAQVQPEWALRMPSERAAVMQRVAAIMETRQAEIVSWLIKEAGSTRIKAQLEWQSVHAVMLEAAMAPYRVEGRILPADIPGKECRVYRKPVGVVGVISPWNWPLQLT
ncbi:MAG: aldehyde dehydrogenase family protein, partial [Acidobacteriota bacterium]